MSMGTYNYSESIFIRAFGDFYKVVCIAKSVDEANEFMAANEGTGLIIEDEKNGLYWIAENAPTEFK